MSGSGDSACAPVQLARSDAVVSLVHLRPTHASFIYLERYVNRGSPSGFSELNMPGPGFRASDPIESFDLPIFDCSAAGAVNVGETPTLPVGALPIHPEMANDFATLLGQAPSRHARATATSSGRTLSVLADGVPFYTKVAYQRLLGRITRKMTRSHVLSSVEVSGAYERAIAAGRMPRSFYIYREHSGLYFAEDSTAKNWGYVERDITPYPRGSFIEVPAFSLIATLRNEGRGLLTEMLEIAAPLRKPDGFFEFFVRPLVDLYFSSVTVLGLQPEAHAQNVVCLLNDSYLPVGFALRDMESVDKDLPLLEARELAGLFTSTGYKFLLKDAYNYQIMHSFMYDFKFGQYLLGPLVDAWGANVGADRVRAVEEQTKRYVRRQLLALPDDFFPDGVWYDYEAVVHEGASTRQYRQHPHPRFR